MKTRESHDLRVPSLWCPLPAALHPSWRRMEDASREWLRRFGLASDRAAEDRLAAIGVGELGGRVTARAVDLEHAQFAADSVLWVCAFDDTCDEGAYSHDPGRMALLAADLLHAAETGRVRSDLPLVVALAELRRRIDGGLGSRLQAARWSRALYGYLFYQVWEVGHRSAGSVPDLDSYLVARMFTSSLPVGIAWLEIANGYRIPDAELHSPSVRALGEMCCATIGYDNDIISHWKETRRGGDGINLIDILARELQAPPGKALTEAVALRDRVLNRYLRLRDQTLPVVSEPTRRYITDLDAWIRGHIDWAMNSRRYRNPDLPASAVADSPTCTDMTPVRGVTHWWDVGVAQVSGA